MRQVEQVIERLCLQQETCSQCNKGLRVIKDCIVMNECGHMMHEFCFRQLEAERQYCCRVCHAHISMNFVLNQIQIVQITRQGDHLHRRRKTDFEEIITDFFFSRMTQLEDELTLRIHEITLLKHQIQKTTQDFKDNQLEKTTIYTSPFFSFLRQSSQYSNQKEESIQIEEEDTHLDELEKIDYDEGDSVIFNNIYKITENSRENGTKSYENERKNNDVNSKKHKRTQGTQGAEGMTKKTTLYPFSHLGNETKIQKNEINLQENCTNVNETDRNSNENGRKFEIHDRKFNENDRKFDGNGTNSNENHRKSIENDIKFHVNCTNSNQNDRKIDVNCTNSNQNDRKIDVNCTNSNQNDRKIDVNCTKLNENGRKFDVNGSQSNDNDRNSHDNGTKSYENEINLYENSRYLSEKNDFCRNNNVNEKRKEKQTDHFKFSFGITKYQQDSEYHKPSNLISMNEMKTSLCSRETIKDNQSNLESEIYFQSNPMSHLTILSVSQFNGSSLNPPKQEICRSYPDKSVIQHQNNYSMDTLNNQSMDTLIDSSLSKETIIPQNNIVNALQSDENDPYKGPKTSPFYGRQKFNYESPQRMNQDPKIVTENGKNENSTILHSLQNNITMNSKSERKVVGASRIKIEKSKSCNKDRMSLPTCDLKQMIEYSSAENLKQCLDNRFLTIAPAKQKLLFNISQAQSITIPKKDTPQKTLLIQQNLLSFPKNMLNKKARRPSNTTDQNTYNNFTKIPKFIQKN